MFDEKMAVVVASFKAVGIRVKYDNTEHNRPGWKFAEYELKGVPIRIAVGPRDLENNQVELARRDTKEKTAISLDGLTETVAALLLEIQSNLLQRATAYRDAHITSVDTWDEFINVLDNKTGFVLAHWDGTAETEEKIKDQTKATIRCIPLDNPLEVGKCILTGNPSKQRVLFARAY
jgi:prolyl-tRNA synthetase